MTVSGDAEKTVICRILVTYGWCRTAYLALRSLHLRGYEVFTCSSIAPSMCAWSRFSRRNAVVANPFADPDRYASDVADLIARWNIDAVMPGHEDAIALRRHPELIAESKLVCPDLSRLENSVDKAWITHCAMRAGVPVPLTRFPDSANQARLDADSIGYPVVIKTRRGNSGKGVIAASNPMELDAAMKRFMVDSVSHSESFPIIQSCLDGAVVGTCFLACEGKPAAIFGERYLRCKDGRFGTSVFREPLRNNKLFEYTERMIDHLGWTGIGHFDFIEAPDGGEFYLLEMNPRLWGAINLSFINGYDFPAACIAAFSGDPDDVADCLADNGRNRRSLWIAGEGIAAVNRIKREGFRSFARIVPELIRSLANTRFDDLAIDDPLPLIAELMCYGRMFIQSGGDTNPATEGMLG